MPKDPPKKRVARAKAAMAKKDDPAPSSAKKRAKAKPKKPQLKLRPPKQRVIEEEDEEGEEEEEEETQSQIDAAYQAELDKLEEEERRDDERERLRVVTRETIRKRLEISKSVEEEGGGTQLDTQSIPTQLYHPWHITTPPLRAPHTRTTTPLNISDLGEDVIPYQLTYTT